MKIEIYNIRAVADGGEFEVSLEVSGGEGKTQQIKGKISFSLYGELGLPMHLSEPIEISREECEKLMFLMQKTSAIKRGIVFLEYAKNTKRGLKNKLTRKGYSPEIAEEAVEYLAEKEYIHEENDASQYAETLAARKLYGKSRIKKELFAKGYESDVITDTLEELDVDFAKICAKRIEKSGGFTLFSDPESKRKTTAALLRYGFSYDNIREALDMIRSNEE